MSGVIKQCPIKGLNKGSGRKRFMFKSFSQRIGEVDVDVFRSLAPLKSEPSAGASFFHESLVSWRELNSAVDFTAVYEKLLPIVQTLPQIILHKQLIMDTLLSHLQLSAVHSLEPIFSLIAILSRDLRSDFIMFVPRFLGACADLFQSGGDREPDIIEQAFTSLSYIFKYIQKPLCKDIKFILKATKRLRYYRKLYIQEFATEAVSYLLRKSSNEELIKGIRRLLTEVLSKPSKENINSCSSLLWYTLKGPGMTVHSRADSVLTLLIDKATFASMRKKDPGGEVIVEVLSDVLQRLCNELEPGRLTPVWSCLLDELNSFFEEGTFDRRYFQTSIEPDKSSHIGMDGACLNKSSGEDSEEMQGIQQRGVTQFNSEEVSTIANLLALTNHLLEFKKGIQVTDFRPLFSISQRLLQCLVLVPEEQSSSPKVCEVPFTTVQGKVNALSFQIWRFILNLIRSYDEIKGTSSGSSDISFYAQSWAQLWKHHDLHSLLYFVQGLLKHGGSSISIFLPDILRACDESIHTQPMCILPLTMDLFEKMEDNGQLKISEKLQCKGLFSFMASTIKNATRGLHDLMSTCQPIEPALVWGILRCFPHVIESNEHERQLVKDYILALDDWLTAQKAASVKILDDNSQRMWEFLLATALSTEVKVLSHRARGSLLSQITDSLNLIVRYKSSAFILKSIADFLDLLSREVDVIKDKEFVPVNLQGGQALSLLEQNLGSKSKLLRLSTLRLLMHLDDCMEDDLVMSKRRKNSDGSFQKGHHEFSDLIFEKLHSIEAAPYSLESGRQSGLVLTRLKISISTGNLSEHYLSLLTHAMVGIIFNPFGLLWDVAVDCLSGLLGTGKIAVWDTYAYYLETFLRQFQSLKEELATDGPVNHAEFKDYSLSSRMKSCLHDEGESTDVGTMVTLLLKAAQKVPTMAEGRTRQLVPLFLTFVGHASHDSHLERTSGEIKHSCRGKDWKLVLKEWLILLSNMRNAVSYFKSSIVKEVLINRFLIDADPDIQLKSLECVLNWKDSYLTVYEDHLKNLILPKKVREELTTWNVGKEGENIQLGHRDGLLHILLRILFPKILKTKTRLHNKTTGGVQRKAVLGFLSALEAHELSLFFILILKPLENAFTKDGMSYIQADRAWEVAIKEGVHNDFIGWVDVEEITKLTHKKKAGFLHMLKDILDTFDKDHVRPYLHALLAFCFSILHTCQVNIMTTTASADQAQDAGKKDIRTLCFKVLAVVFSKYDDAEFCPLYWDRFFGTVQPMISRFGDEGASGDAPSALFSCFLSMSRSLALASILLQNENVIPNVLSLISHKNASISVIGASLSFVENLLALNQENASLLTTYFLPHLPLLLSNLMGLLSAQRKGSRSFSPATKRGLFILLKVSRQINRVSDINQLVEVLLPFLQKHEKKRQGVVEEIVDVLHVLEELGPNLSEENCNRTFPFFSQLLAFSSDLDVRLAICRILFAFASANSSLCFIANLISDLNSMSSSTVGEYDYERRIEAYGRLTVVSFVEMTYEQVHLVIAQSSYDLQSDDLSIRHCASNCISLFVQFLSSKCNSNKVCGGGNDPNGGEVDIDRWGMICESTKTSLSVVWDPEAVTMAVQKLLLPNVRKAMNLASLPVRREWVSLLRNMVLNLPEVPPFGELVALTNTDLEVDFFHNITHIQTHRRIRAMSRFKELCSTGRFSQGTLVRVFEPLFTHSLSEGKGDKDGNLVQSAVETIACIATQLQWDPYYGLLMKLFRMVSSEAGLEKTMIRLLCAVLDSFHFNEGVEGRLEKTIDAHDSCMLEVPHNKDNCSIPDQILKQLKSHILPEFMKLMVSKGNIVNVSVSVAIVKVLQLMPSDTMELELPRVILNIVNRLKSRNHVIRDEARAGLVAVASTLGARYFGFVVEKLEESLRRGFELHVLGFTLNALILKIFSKLKVGEIDYCAGKILGLLLNDIFDEVSEEKEVEKMAGKMKEIKRSGSYESLKLVAEFISFDVHSVTIFQAVRKRLKDTLDAKTKGKIERVLRQLAVGIEQNLSLKQEQLFVFVHGLVEHGVTQEDSEKKLSFPDGRSVTNLPGDGGVEENIPNYYLVTEFALHLLEVHLKRAKLNNEDPSLLALLDPVFTLLQRCIESRHTGVLGLALKCLCHLVSVPLQGIARSGGAFLDRVIAIAQRFERTENPVAQPCFNLLVSLLKHAKCLHVSEDQLRTLLQFPVFISLDKAESNMGLQLLKAIVSRKLLVPELYDIINTVSKLMVTSHVPSIQQYCRQIMLQFLLDYPLGSRRLQQHLDFLVVNLSYVNATGREAVLEMLHAVIVKFPAQAIDEQFETVFLPLVTRLLNDDSNQLRLMIGSILKLLIKRISHRSLQRVLQFCFSWLREDKHHLWRAAGQVLGFMVEVMEAKYLTYLKDTLMLSYRILDHVLEVNGAEKRRIATDIGPVLWQEAYCILTLVEKLMKQFPDVMLEKSNEGLWEILVLLLLHQHAWVRKSSSRLLDMYFVASGASNGIKEAMPMKLNTQQPFLLQPSRLMQIFAILSLQLDSELDEDLASLLEKNLFFSISTLHRFFHGKDKLSWMDVVHEKDSEAQGRAREALDMLKVEDLMLKEFCRLPQMNNFHRVSAIPGNSMKETLDIKYYGLYPIFKTLEKIALKSNDLQMTTVFHLYDGLLIHLGKDGVQPYLCSMLCPLHRTSESTTARTVSAELRTLAEAVLGRIRETVGFEDFVHAYNETRKKTKDIRETRKRAKKLKVLLDPMAHAKRKIKLNAKRQIQKRKKRMDIHLQQR